MFIKPEHVQRFLKAGVNWILYAADIIASRDGINGDLRFSYSCDSLKKKGEQVVHRPHLYGNRDFCSFWVIIGYFRVGFADFWGSFRIFSDCF